MPFDSSEFDYADIKVSVLGREVEGLRGITYKKSQEKELIYGAGNEPKAVSKGNKKYEGTLTLLKSDYDDLGRAARAAGFSDLLDLPGRNVNITITYQKADNPTKLSVDTLINVEFTEIEDGQKQGDKFKEIALPFIFLKLKQA